MNLTTVHKKSMLLTYGLLLLGLSCGLDYFFYNSSPSVYHSPLGMISAISSITALVILCISVLILNRQIWDVEQSIILIVAMCLLFLPHVFKSYDILDTRSGDYYFIGILLTFVDYAAFASVIFNKARQGEAIPHT